MSICPQADLDRRYVEKLSQLDWINRTARNRNWTEVTIDLISVPVAMTGKLYVNFVTDMEKLGISRPRSLLLARRIVATVIPGLASNWRHAVRQFIMAAHGEGWDDPGPRQPGFRPGPRRAGPQGPPSDQNVAPPRWARQHLSQLEEARRLQSLGDERTADQLMLAVISLLGQSYTTRVR